MGALVLLMLSGRDLREAGLRCVEKIVAWVLFMDPDAAEPTPFLWNGQVRIGAVRKEGICRLVGRSVSG